MQTNKIYRRQMREALKGKWFKFFLIALAYQVLISAVNRALNYGFDVLLEGVNNAEVVTSTNMIVGNLLIQPLFTALYVGLYAIALSVLEGAHPVFAALIPGKFLYGRALVLKYVVAAVIGIPAYASLLLWAFTGDSIVLQAISLICMLAGLVWLFKKALDYALSDLVLLTETELSAREILRTSRLRIKGHRWQYLRLGISVAVWMLVPEIVIAFTVKNVWISFVLTSICGAVIMPCTLLASAAFFRDIQRIES